MNHFLAAALFFVCPFITFAETYTVFEENGKFGLLNQSGDVLIPAIYERLGWSDETFSVVNGVTGYSHETLWGLITINNQILTPAEFFSLSPGSSSLLIASKRSPLTLRISTGCINTSGKTVIPFNYSGIRMHSQRAIVYVLDENRLKYGLIDLNNKLILPTIYKNIYPLGSLRYAVQDFRNKTALYTENGRPVTGFLIDSVAQVQHGLAIFYQEGKLGLIDRDGKIIRQPLYRHIELKDNTYNLHRPDQWHILEASNKVTKQIEADSIVPVAPNRIKRVTSAGTQLLDANFNLVGHVPMDEILSVHGNLIVFRNGGKTGIVHLEGHQVLPAKYDRVIIDHGALLTYSTVNGRRTCALYDLSGTLKTSRTYDAVLPFNGTVFPVARGGYFGAIDRNGNEIIACTYDSIGKGAENLLMVKFRNNYGIIDLNEQWVVLPQPNRINLLNTERYFEYEGELKFLKSIDGTTIYFTTNLFEIHDANLIEYVSGGGKWTINLNGQIIHREQPPNEYAELIFDSSEGYRGIRRNGRYGFVDDLGRLRIANRYENIKPFREGLAAVQIRGKWGFINKEDRIVIQPVYETVDFFEHGRAKATQSGKAGLIDNQGNVLLPFRYDALSIHPNGRISITSGGQTGLADEHGNILLQPKYDYLQDLDNGYVIVKQYDKYGLVNLQGITTIPVIYDYLVYEPTHNVYFGMTAGVIEQLARP